MHRASAALRLPSRRRTVALLSNFGERSGDPNVNTRSIILGLLSGVLMLSGLAAKAGTAEEAVIAAENQITKSQQTNNVELQAPLLADKYVSTDEDGKVIVGKEANLADAKLTTFSSTELTDLKVTVFGDTAIATGAFASKGTYQGKPFDSRGRFTDTWVRLNGKWLCVATHISLTKKA